MYEKYLIELPQADASLLNAKTARSVVGAALSSEDVFEKDRFLLFARDERGQPLQREFSLDGMRYAAPAPVLIGGTERRVVLIGLGTQGVELVRKHLVTIANALSRYTKSMWSLQHYSGACDVSTFGTRMYYSPTFVVEKNKRKFNAILERLPKAANGDPIPDMAVINNLLERAVVHGLIGQALMLDEDCGSNLFGKLPSAERLGVNIISGTPFMMRLNAASNAHAIAVKNLVFSMDAQLSGPWFAGQLRARLCGQIKPLLPRDLERIEQPYKGKRA